MCRPSPGTKHVVIAGAGPAGLLAAILLLRRNANDGGSATDTPKYRVTLVDPGADYGLMDQTELNRARSWMIGLSSHGLDAIREVPRLYDDYVRGLGVDITHVVFGITKSIKLNVDAKQVLPEDSAFTVDRNFICAALSRYLNEQHGDDPCFRSRYHTRGMYVDGENKHLVARMKIPEGVAEDVKIGYDYILGCDGIRSVVRNAFVNTHRDFEFALKGTFGFSKSVHVALPKGIEPGTFMFINNALPGCGSFVLPETGNKLNVAIGSTLNKEFPEELKSDDPSVIAAYFRKHFHAFDIDAEETGKQWVAQGLNTISQVHVNFYHSDRLSALLLGDAAHATSPQIGQGMNTALADAAALDALLDEHKDDWTAVLPKFSEERVKEGNALTDLSFYTYSLSATQQLSLMIRQQTRVTLNKYLPWLVAPDPMSEIPKGMKLSEAYNLMVRYGVIPRVRAENDRIMREHFEETTGMVVKKQSSGFFRNVALVGLPVAAAYAASQFLESN